MTIIDTLQKRKEEADKLVNDIRLKTKTIEERLIKSTEVLNSIKSQDKEYSKFLKQIKEIQNKASESIVKFQSEKNTIVDYHAQIQKFYNSKYLPLVEKIEDENNGIAARQKQVNSTTREINSIGNHCKSQFDKIKKYAEQYTKTLKSLENLDSSIRKIYIKVQKHESNSKTLVDAIKEAKSNVDTFEKNILQQHNNSRRYEQEISELLNKSNAEYDHITSIKNKSENTLKEILDIYEIAADTGRSGEFDKRRKSLSIELKKWERHIMFSTIGLFIVIIALFVWQLGLKEWQFDKIGVDISFYCRFLLTSPIIYYITFASMQYNKTKKLVDIYSYKTTMAMSIKSHLELLTANSNFEKYNEDILQFTLEAFRKIYNEPYKDDEDFHLRIKMQDLELQLEKKIQGVKDECTKLVQTTKQTLTK
ncbi:MAG: hypothetical protein LBK94_07220 [Prevotellaceae bacterium]|jgi:hypothetical protein|nr:hypothetical protein [Prevotellaceae bacterium]